MIRFWRCFKDRANVTLLMFYMYSKGERKGRGKKDDYKVFGVSIWKDGTTSEEDCVNRRLCYHFFSTEETICLAMDGVGEENMTCLRP